VNGLECFEEIWCADFEFSAPAGHQPAPICLVASELRTGRHLRLWEDQLAQMRRPPFRTDSRALFVAYAASAELGCFHVLGWEPPARVLDLFFEFRAATNGLQTPSGAGLLGALVYHGLPAMDGAEKESMRQLAIRGGPFTDAERAALLDYCAEDVVALARLLPAMLPRIDLPRALLRGRYAWAVASMEHRGIPIDAPTFEHLRGRWKSVQGQLVAEVDSRYGVFDKTTFKRERFERWLVARDIPWPRLESGQLDLSDDCFRSQAKAYPAVAELRELKAALSSMRLFEDLAIGPDGRNRTSIAPFRARTGRNQPSNARFIFGPSRWLRSLIQPAPGMALAYVDFEQQEFGIAAALSGDAAMAEAYRSGDPYLAFGKQAGAIPPDGTKATHAAERALFKACTLAVQYGMGPEGLAQKIGRPVAAARELLGLHRATYPAFWRWSQAAVDRATLLGELQTVFGWPIRVGPSPDPMRPGANPRSLANFPCQANGAEMLRLAACLLVERGIGLCAPVHDAVLVEGPAREIEEVVAQTRAAMAEASRVVLAGFEIGTDAKIIRWPDRYVDEAGADFWDTVLRLAGPAPQFGNPADGVRQSGRTSSAILPNRGVLLEESSRGVSSSLSVGAKR
jgi:DNA polymerase-1